MSSPVNADLVREIADRIDDGRRVNLQLLSRDLDVDFEDLYDAYRELARRRGHDPLLDRAQRRLDAAERLRSRPR
jgi:hypothetical protein